MFSDSCVAYFVVASALFGYGISVLNTTIKHVTLLLELCGNGYTPKCPEADTEIDRVTTLFFVGAAVGALSAGKICGYGRRFALGVAHVGFVAGGLTTGLATGLVSLYIGRTTTGVAVGLASVVVPMFINEMSRVDKRGSRGVFHQIMITVGILVGIAMGLFLAPIPPNPQPDFSLTSDQKYYLRAMLGSPAAVSVGCLVLLFSIFRDDSPAYWVVEDDKGKAGRILQKIYKTEDVEDQLAEMVKANQDTRRLGESPRVSCWDFTAAYIWVFTFGIVLSIGQQLSGINVFVTLSNRVFEDAGLPAEYSSAASTGMAVANMLMTFPAIYLVEKFGRRSLLMAGVFGQTVFLSFYPLVVAIFGKEASFASIASVVSVIGFIMCFAVGYGPVLWLYLPEIFSPEIRGMGAGMAAAANWVATIGIVAAAGRFESDVTKFLTFTGCSAFSLLWIIAFMRETKGSTVSPFFPKKQLETLNTETAAFLNKP